MFTASTMQAGVVFAAARRAGEEHQSRGVLGKGHHVVRNAQLLTVGQGEGDHPITRPMEPLCRRGVHPKVEMARNGEGEIVVPVRSSRSMLRRRGC